LPDLHELDPEACHLAWHLVLEGEVDRARIEEVFDWVSGAAEITYQRFPEEPDTEAAPSTAATAEPAVATPSSAAAPAAAVPGGKSETNSMRVATEKVDALLNLVGELVITQSMLSRFGERMDASQIDALREGLAQLTRNTRELQESVMQIRMLPISFSFNRFPRLVHDLSRRLGKQVELKLIGEGTELDKTVLEKIGDPLVHLVRNALDHGIESPAVRLAAGKSANGLIELNAHHEGGSIVVEVRDDGSGLNRARILAKARERGLVGANDELSDEQVQNLIFAPGFSTADQVSDVSGRGVGMDVVRRNITDLGGHVQITSVEGRGSTVRIRLPLTLAILDGQLVRCGSEIYIISLVAIVETIQIPRERLSAVAGRTELFRLRDEYLPIVRLHEQFGIEPDSRDPSEGLLVVVESDGTRVGILVDDLLAQQQVVIKSLETNFRQVEGLAGATILGDGTVAPIIDVPGLIRNFARSQRTRTPRPMAAA
ncbi:MAG TPA: chemotaxis protein CheA, partial [Steroidobacteraceae bacterium]|nr:chemotaxis protein CheA [Steroidobacteraceae bacterium]